MAERLTATRFHASDGVDDWRFLLGRVDATFVAPTPSAAAAFVAAVVDLAPRRVPDLDLRGTAVHVTVPGEGDLVADDVEVARRVSAAARGLGLTSAPGGAVRAEIAIDALDIDAVRPFWRAALAYDEVAAAPGEPVDTLVDPRRVGPPVWFQQMDALRPERNHIHIDVTVPHDVAEQRVREVVAAGGRHLFSRRRSFHVLADVEGNEVCICTWLDRDPPDDGVGDGAGPSVAGEPAGRDEA